VNKANDENREPQAKRPATESNTHFKDSETSIQSSPTKVDPTTTTTTTTTAQVEEVNCDSHKAADEPNRMVVDSSEEIANEKVHSEAQSANGISPDADGSQVQEGERAESNKGDALENVKNINNENTKTGNEYGLGETTSNK
jgi:hypothetical protein